MKGKNQVIGLRTLRLVSSVPSIPRTVKGVQVFDEAAWHKLNQMSTKELKSRIHKGDILKAVTSTDMGSTKEQAGTISSNIKYQQDAIQKIIDARTK